MYVNSYFILNCLALRSQVITYPNTTKIVILNNNNVPGITGTLLSGNYDSFPASTMAR